MSSQFQVVSVLDPAIATERMTADQMRKYIDERDMSVIAPFVKPGCKLMVFHCDEVQHELWESYVMSGSSDFEKANRAFQCGVRRVDNFIQYADSRMFESWSPNSKPDSRLQYMSSEDAARFKPCYREEIGTVIFQRSFLDPRIKVACPLPHTSLSILGQLPFLRVEQSQSAQPQSSAPPSSSDSDSDQYSRVETPSATTSSEEGLGSRTDAPARATG